MITDGRVLSTRVGQHVLVNMLGQHVLVNMYWSTRSVNMCCEQEYRSALQVLLPPDVSATSHHARWAATLQAVAGRGGADTTDTTAQPPTDDDVDDVLQRLCFAAALAPQQDPQTVPSSEEVALCRIEADAAAAAAAAAAVQVHQAASVGPIQEVCREAADALGTRGDVQ